MKAFLLAAGLGTRLRPLTNTIPKCLVPINGRPLLDYWLELLVSQGIEKVLINTHYFADQVEDYLTNSEWKDNACTVYEKSLLGTAGSIKANAGFFEADEGCLVAHADNLTQFSLNGFEQKFQNRPASCHITLMTFTTDNPKSCGIVEEDENGVVQAFHEKVEHPPGNHANGAIYILDQTALSFIKNITHQVIDFSTEVIPHFLGKMNSYHNDQYLRDIGTPEMLVKAESDLEQGKIS